MTTRKTAREPDRDPEIGTSDAPVTDDVDGHSLLQSDFHRQIATSRARESVEWTRPGQSRKQTKEQSKGRNGR